MRSILLRELEIKEKKAKLESLDLQTASSKEVERKGNELQVLEDEQRVATDLFATSKYATCLSDRWSVMPAIKIIPRSKKRADHAT